jgi:hypothetical protein
LNAKKFIVFQIVILQHSPNGKQAKGIQKWILRRMEAWEVGKFTMLVQDTEQAMESFLTTKQGGEVTTDQQAKISHRKMLQGDVRGAVRYLTEREKGGILLPNDVDDKLGQTALRKPWNPSTPMLGFQKLHCSQNTPIPPALLMLTFVKSPSKHLHGDSQEVWG